MDSSRRSSYVLQTWNESNVPIDSVVCETEHTYHARRGSCSHFPQHAPAHTKITGPFLARDLEFVDVYVVLPPQRMQVMVGHLVHKYERTHSAHPRGLVRDDLRDCAGVALEGHEIVGVVYDASAALEDTTLHVVCHLYIRCPLSGWGK
jgi:hypothetical protein